MGGGVEGGVELGGYGRTVARHAPHDAHDTEHDEYHHVSQQVESQPNGINNPDCTIKPLDA